MPGVFVRDRTSCAPRHELRMDRSSCLEAVIAVQGHQRGTPSSEPLRSVCGVVGSFVRIPARRDGGRRTREGGRDKRIAGNRDRDRDRDRDRTGISYSLPSSEVSHSTWKFPSSIYVNLSFPVPLYRSATISNVVQYGLIKLLP